MPTTLHDTTAALPRPLASRPPLSSRRLPSAAAAPNAPRSSRWWQAPPRVQGFEFGDQRWFKGIWREAYLDGLNFSFRLYGVYRRMHEPFARWARMALGSKATHETARVLDLGSGGAGPVETVLACARKSGTDLPRVTLSDLNPDLDAFQRAKAALPERLDFVPESLDACDPEAAASAAPDARLRSVCSAFHHFDPDSARRLLAATTEQADGLFVMEPMGRSWLSPLYSLPNLLPLLLAPFFARRFSFKKVLIGTLLPLVPLMIVFDGVVSALRMYRPEEVLELLPESARRGWHWEFGEKPYMLLFRAPYLFGYRIKSEDHA
ncbi:MAG: hypothetical protein L6R28_12160 [Planctomycetes bacterium]|nr:hypothetical protein [Planctomycetota bacterium]